MHLKSKKTPFLLLFLTSVLCSRILFMLIDDPEGPNLLVVAGAAIVICVPSLVPYVFGRSAVPLSSAAGFRRFSLAVLIQAVLVVVLSFWLS
jgi:hypothetical protein